MRFRHLLFAAMAGAACSSEDPLPGQFGEDEDLVCVEASAEAVDDSDTVVLGTEGTEVVVGDVLALAAGTFEATLTWEATGEQTSITLTSETSASTAERVTTEPASEEIPEHNCGDFLRFPLSGSLATGDGRLDEALSIEATSDGVNVFVDARLEGLRGTLDPEALAVGTEAVEPDQVDVHAMVQDSSAPFQGQVAPVLADNPGEDVTPLGTWPGELED